MPCVLGNIRSTASSVTSDLREQGRPSRPSDCAFGWLERNVDCPGDFNGEAGRSLERTNESRDGFGITQASAAELVGCEQLHDDRHEMGAIPDQAVCRSI